MDVSWFKLCDHWEIQKHIGVSETEERVARQAFTAISGLVGALRGMCTGSCNLETSLAEVHEI